MYAQTQYTQKVGNGPYSIAQIGCFITAFSNLLSRFGIDENPEALNQFFTAHNVYLADPGDGAGVKDDLAWSSITAYSPIINVTRIRPPKIINGQYQSVGWPPSDTAIVEFHYRHGEHWVTHFCLVSMASKGTIIDSYDGVIKAPGMYGQPVAWACYEKEAPRPVPVAPAKPAVAAPLPAPVTVSHPAPAGAPLFPNSMAPYVLYKEVRGYRNSGDAALRRLSNSTVHPSDKSHVYTVFNRWNGMVNITLIPGRPGWWINPADNVQGGHGEGGSIYIGPREHSDSVLAPVIATPQPVPRTPKIDIPIQVSLPAVPGYTVPAMYRRAAQLPRRTFRDRVAEWFGTMEGYPEYRRNNKQGVRR